MDSGREGARKAPLPGAPSTAGRRFWLDTAGGSGILGAGGMTGNVFEPGDACGGAEVVRLLGAGGFSEVYEVIDAAGQRRALKVLAIDEQASPRLSARLAREAEALGRIEHVNVVRLHDAGLHESHVWLLLELVAGKPLREALHGLGHTPAPWTVARWLRQAADGVAEAHRVGVLHRDLKPDNLLVTAASVVKVIDFGLAKLTGAGPLTTEAQRLGTALYTAPELFEGKAPDGRSEVYAMGLVLFEALAGSHPFATPASESGEASTLLAIGARHRAGGLPSLGAVAPWVPPSLEAIAGRATARDPGQRFQTMAALSEALRDAILEAEEQRRRSSASLLPRSKPSAPELAPNAAPLSHPVVASPIETAGGALPAGRADMRPSTTMPHGALARAFARLRRACDHPRIFRRVTLLAALLAIPVLFQGLQVDDHALRAQSLGIPPWDQWKNHALELFTFFDGDRARTHSIIDRGFSVWWTDPDLRVRFFRPLSALSHWIDFRLFDRWALPMHAENAALYVALVAVVGAFYRRALAAWGTSPEVPASVTAAKASWVAGLAALLYAVDPSHALLVEWISNRNALLAAVFAVLALVYHHRARSEGKPRFAIVSALCLALGLLSGEVALGGAAYLAAHALFLDEAPARERMVGLVPHLVVLAAWLVVYKLGHYGAHGSGMYVDPGEAPLEFAKGAVTHLPLLLQIELGGLPTEGLVFIPQAPAALYWALGAIGAVGLLGLLPLVGDRRARFLLAGAVLAMIPSAATLPAARLMLLPSLGIMGLLAMLMARVGEGAHARWPRPLRWAAWWDAVIVGGSHVVVAPLLLMGNEVQFVPLEALFRSYGDSLDTLEPQGPVPLAEQRVMVVAAPDSFFAYYAVSQRLTEGRPIPRGFSVVATGTRPVELERLGPSDLAVHTGEGFYRFGTELLTRAPWSPMPVGTRVELSDFTIEVTRTTADGVPTDVVFHFARPLEDPTLRWVVWKGRTYAPFHLPAVGEKARIEPQLPSL